METHLAEADLRHVVRRAQRLAERGVPPAGIAGIRARAADRSELAREISAALQAHDLAHAQALIHEGAAVFGHAAMVAAVEAQARQERTEAMGAVQGPASQYRASWGHHGAALVHGR